MRRSHISALMVLVAAVLSSAAFAQAPDNKPTDRTQLKSVDPQVTEFNRQVVELKKLYAAREFHKAIEPAQAVVRLAIKIYGKRHVRYSGSLFNLGMIYKRAGQLAAAEQSLAEAFTVQHSLRSPADKTYRQVITELAATQRQLGQARKTVDYYKLALQRLAKLGQQESSSAVYYTTNLGVLYRYVAKFRLAERTLRHALATRRKISPPGAPSLVNQLNALAGLLRNRGKFSQAEPLYKEAIDITIASRGEWHANTGILLDNLAVMYLNMGAHEKAEPLQKRALAIIEKTLGPNNRSTGIALGNLAELQLNLGRPRESEALFKRSIAIMEKTLAPNHPILGYALDNLGGLYRQSGRYDLAYKTFNRALRRLEAAYGRQHPEVATALNNMALVLGELGQHEKAQTHLLESLKIARKSYGDGNISLAATYGNLADQRLNLGRLDEAESDAQRALKIVNTTLGDRHPKLMLPLTYLGRVAQRRDQLHVAYEYYQRAAGIYERLRRRGGDKRVGFTDQGSIERLLEVAFARHEQFGGANDEMLKTAFRFSQLKTLTSASAALNKLGARLGANNPQLRQLARARQDAAAAWTKADAALIKAVSRKGSARDAKQEAGLRAQSAFNAKRVRELDERLTREFPDFAELSRPRPAEIEHVQQLLQDDEVLLQYLVTGTHVYGWAVTKNRTAWHRIALSRQSLRRMVATLRCGLDPSEWLGETKPLNCLKLTGRFAENGHLPFATDVAHQLYQALIKPFAAQLRSRNLIVVGSDALTRLPMHVLLTEPVRNDRLETLASAPWLLRRHAITDLPSISSFAILRRSGNAQATRAAMANHKARRAYFAVANPLLLGADGQNRSAFSAATCPKPTRSIFVDAPNQKVASVPGAVSHFFRGGRADVERLKLLEPLPETTAEICAVAQDLGVATQGLLIGASATEAKIKSANEGPISLADYRILHFATHGLVSGELKGLAEPALVLTPPKQATDIDDGMLTASEIASLKLDADWVILSACNTAAGADYGAEALSGLARSFFYAGARSLLVSHWPVRSDAAVELTTVAIRVLNRDPNLGRSGAMRQAMLKLIDNDAVPASAHPQVWAPFVMVGEGAPQR